MAKRSLIVIAFFLTGLVVGWWLYAPTVAWLTPTAADVAATSPTDALKGPAIFILGWGVLFAMAPLASALLGHPVRSLWPTALYLLLGLLASGAVALYYHWLVASSAEMYAKLSKQWGASTVFGFHELPLWRIPVLGAAFVFVVAGTQRLLAARASK